MEREDETCDACHGYTRSGGFSPPMSYFLELDTRLDGHGELCHGCATQFYDWLLARRAAQRRTRQARVTTDRGRMPRSEMRELAFLRLLAFARHKPKCTSARGLVCSCGLLKAESEARQALGFPPALGTTF